MYIIYYQCIEKYFSTMGMLISLTWMLKIHEQVFYILEVILYNIFPSFSPQGS